MEKVAELDVAETWEAPQAPLGGVLETPNVWRVRACRAEVAPGEAGAGAVGRGRVEQAGLPHSPGGLVHWAASMVHEGLPHSARVALGGQRKEAGTGRPVRLEATGPVGEGGLTSLHSEGEAAAGWWGALEGHGHGEGQPAPHHQLIPRVLGSVVLAAILLPLPVCAHHCCKRGGGGTQPGCWPAPGAAPRGPSISA